ncbi:FKBP-type peptidyl-prolyl cis-trans isomerase [Microbacterium sp. NPDC091313]
MRRTPALLAVTALVAVGLVGCASTSDASSCNPTEQNAGALAGVSVTGADDAKPTIDVRTPFKVGQTSTEVLDAGDGTAISSDNQLVVLDISIASGSTGETVISTPYNGDMSRVFALSEWTQGLPGLSSALQCVTEGSRLVIGLAPEDLAEGAAASIGLADDESAVAVVDVRKVYLAKADGADVFNDAHGLPTVVRAPDGRPGIIIPDATAPTDTVTQVLERGDGDVVGDDSTVRAAYTSVSWKTRRQVDSSWDSAPIAVSEQTLPAAVVDAVKGQTVGSQIMVVVPAQGDGSATVYVLDLLGIDG